MCAQQTVLAIDFGASTTKAVLLQDKKVLKTAIWEKISNNKTLEKFLKKNFTRKQIVAVAITGGKSSFFNGKIFGFKPKKIDEILAIGKGTAFLAKSNHCLCVSLGTGTCIVHYSNGVATHVIGSGIGGGTITGLTKLVCKTTEIKALKALAKKGKLGKTDLTVCDIVGKKIGLLGENATASNFAGQKKVSTADLAVGIQNLVAESIAVLAISTARNFNEKKIVFSGSTLNFPIVKERLSAAARLFGSRFVFPEKAEFATAIGAALSVKK